ncbi:hypothetical protein Droror1_Dr00007055 [Drosera rotundifolia]
MRAPGTAIIAAAAATFSSAGSSDSGNVCRGMVTFLINHHTDELHSILLSPDPRLHYPLFIDFAELLDDNPPIAQLVFCKPAEYLPVFDRSAVSAQGHLLKDLEEVCSGANVKDYVHVRVDVSGSPLECPETFPSIGRV